VLLVIAFGGQRGEKVKVLPSRASASRGFTRLHEASRGFTRLHEASGILRRKDLNHDDDDSKDTIEHY